MLDILGVTGPIYIAIFLGWATVRGGLFSAADMRVFGKFVIHLALPALLFNALAQRPLAEILVGSYLVAYALASLLVVVLGLLWCRARGEAPTAGVVQVMGMVCSNSGFVGFPILLLVLPSVAGLALALNMVIENALVIPLLLALAERSRGVDGHWVQALGQSLQRLVRNPMVWALVAGFLVALGGWHLPGPVLRAVNLFALASGGLSLFVIGGSLVGLSIGGLLRPVLPVVLAKLVLFPLLLAGVLAAMPAIGFAPLPEALRHAALLLAAMPMMGIYPILAMQYGQQGVAAAAMLFATAASFVTLNLLLVLLGLPG